MPVDMLTKRHPLCRTKGWAVLLCLVVLCSILAAPWRAQAQEKAPVFYDQVKAAEALSQLGMLQGSSKGLELDRQPSRAEASVMFVRLLGLEPEALRQDYKHPFGDVPEWASRYVGLLWSKKLANGVSPTEYAAEEPVTEQMYSALLLRALGYRDDQGEFDYDNPFAKMEQIGLISAPLQKGATGDGSFTRGHVAVLSYLALHCKVNGKDNRLLDQLVAAGAVSRKLSQTLPAVADILLDTPAGQDKDGYVQVEEQLIGRTDGGELRIVGEGLFPIARGQVDYPFGQQSHTLNAVGDKLVFQKGDFNNEVYLLKVDGTSTAAKKWFDFKALYPEDTLSDNEGLFYKNQLYQVNGKYILLKSFIHYSENRVKIYPDYAGRDLMKYAVMNEEGYESFGDLNIPLPDSNLFYGVLDLTYEGGSYFITIGEFVYTNSGYVAWSPSRAIVYKSPDLNNWVVEREIDRMANTAWQDLKETAAAESKSLKNTYSGALAYLEGVLKRNIPLDYKTVTEMGNGGLQLSDKGSTYIKFNNLQEVSGGQETYLFVECYIERVLEKHTVPFGNGYWMNKDVRDGYSVHVLLRMGENGAVELIAPHDLDDTASLIYRLTEAKLYFKQATGTYMKKLAGHYNGTAPLGEEELHSIKNEIMYHNGLVFSLEQELAASQSLVMDRDDNPSSFSRNPQIFIDSEGRLLFSGYKLNPAVWTPYLTGETSEDQWRYTVNQASDNFGFLPAYTVKDTLHSPYYLVYNNSDLDILDSLQEITSLRFYFIHGDQIVGLATWNGTSAGLIWSMGQP
ncbi:MAG: hypothetical protein K0R57_6670 [Paenibacillaceae bacterium]|jgi:hypothetical protein|nr:hypothetical protein [Paenibacillaceae bacterium]